MKRLLFFWALCFTCFSYALQIENIYSKYNAPTSVSESSGLLFYNGKLITHNDSGDGPNLYEMDTISGSIVRTIQITNASHADWEDITQDETYIYIGDFGNNNGSRKDLKIYRILKSDFNNSASIQSDVITFSYEDQQNFTSNPYNHDFDAEAFSIYGDQFILFSKNWATNTLNAYTIPKTIGDHSAKKIGSYNSNGLITGSTYNPEDNSFLLCGYTTDGNPLLIFIKDIDIKAPFSGIIERTDISNSIGIASQIEGIAHISGKKYFLSREYVNRNIDGNQVILHQHIFRFDNGSFTTLGLDKEIRPVISIYPNPVAERIEVKGIVLKKISIINSLGNLVLEQKKSSNHIRINELTTGVYFLKLVTTDNKSYIKKFIKY